MNPRTGLWRLIPDLLRLDPKLPIVVVLNSNDPELVLRCLRHGASDFLIQPFTSDQVEAALQKVARLQPANAGKPGKVYCFMPAKGGCGASTIASNFAYQLKRTGDKRILLADLDPLAGTLSFLLKIKSNYSFMDALARSAEIDADLWKAVINSRQGVDVLLSPEAMTEGMSDLTNASSIVEYARGTYDLVVLDAGGVYGDWNLSQAQRADEILLVTTNELTALQAVQRALGYLEANGVQRYKIKLIVNRYDRHAGLSKDVIGTALTHRHLSHHAHRLRRHPEGPDGRQTARPNHEFRQERHRIGGPPGRWRGTAEEEQFAVRHSLFVFPHVVAPPLQTKTARFVLSCGKSVSSRCCKMISARHRSHRVFHR